MPRRAPGRCRVAGASRPNRPPTRRRAASASPTAPSVSVALDRASEATRPWSRPASSTSSLPGHPAVVARVLIEDPDTVARRGVIRCDRPVVDGDGPAGRSARDPPADEASSSCRRRSGPSRPKTDPAGTSRSRPSTASTPSVPPKRFVRPPQVTATDDASAVEAAARSVPPVIPSRDRPRNRGSAR